MPTAVKPGCPVAGIRPAVVHGRHNRDTGGHFVIQQAAHFLAQNRLDLIVYPVILTGNAAVDTAGQVAFQVGGDFDHLRSCLWQRPSD